MNFVLIGYRATGKTAVGRKVSGMLGREFFDTDEMISRVTGRSVRDIVEEGGWEAFRDREKQAVRSLPETGSHIISLGGGAVLDPENIRELRKRQGVFIWLCAGVDTIEKRLGADAMSPHQRPALQGADKGLAESVRERNIIYRGLADYLIDTSDRDVDEVARRVVNFIEGY